MSEQYRCEITIRRLHGNIRVPVRPPPPILRHLSELGVKVIIQLKDRTEREVTSYEELSAAFTRTYEEIA